MLRVVREAKALREDASNDGIVARRVLERPQRQFLPEPNRNLLLFDGLGHHVVLDWVRDDEDVLVVFGGGPQQAGAPDVDLLNEFRKIDAGLFRRLLEGVEVHYDHVDVGDAVLHLRGPVRRIATAEDPARHLRMQRLETALHHLGKARQVRDIADLQACIPQRLRGPPSRHQFDSQFGQSASEIDDSGLVADRQEGARGGSRHTYVSSMRTPYIGPRRGRVHPTRRE